jgi:P27 family predicted phage terminase small subunit
VLDKLGQETWDRMLWAFEDMGMLHKVDAEALYAYCTLWSETEQVATQQAEARGGLQVLEDNLCDVQAEDKVALFTQIVALHKIVSKCTDQLRAGRMAIRQYLVEFGLTPASRGRIKLPTMKEETDEFSEMQLRRVK